jgi:Uri superfamily endonuclease
MFFARTGVQPSPGTYALLLPSAKDVVIQVGRLGALRLQPGYYAYVGSALGSGGVLVARVWQDRESGGWAQLDAVNHQFGEPCRQSMPPP